MGGETGWHDLLLTLPSYEANRRAETRKEVQPKNGEGYEKSKSTVLSCLSEE